METSQHFRTLGRSIFYSRVFRGLILLLAGSLSGASYIRANEPLVVLSLNELKFEAQAQGTASAPRKILLTNIGTAELIVDSIAVGGENSTDFTETHTCPTAPATLAAAAVCEIYIVFKPRIGGDLSATLSVSDNASGSPQTVSLHGRSSLPVPLVGLSPVTLSFGNQAMGTSSKVQVVVLTNKGSATLNINSAIGITGPASGEFHLQKASGACPDSSGQLAPNASCSIGIVFIPASIGVKSAQVTIVDDAAGSPQTVALSGAGSGT